MKTEGDPARAVAVLKVGSVAETVHWYQLLGFQVQGDAPAGDATWAEVAYDGIVLQFLGGETPWEGAPNFTGCFYAHVPSVDAVYERVKDNVDIEWGVEERDWGARELTLRDPNGYFITFTE